MFTPNGAKGTILTPAHLREKASEILQDAKVRNGDFDAIVVCGTASALMAGIVAQAVAKPIVLIRKRHEVDREEIVADTDMPPDADYIFIDDRTATGGTRMWVHHVMQKHFPDAICVGEYFYSQDLYDAWTRQQQ